MTGPNPRMERAAVILAGLVSNPEVFKMPSWEAECCRIALRLADRLAYEHDVDAGLYEEMPQGIAQLRRA